MANLNYWYRLYKYNKEFRSSVKIVFFIILMVLVIYYSSIYFFPEQ